MLLKMTCFGPTEPSPCTSDKFVLYTAKVMVKTEGGVTCKKAAIETETGNQIFYADPIGYVIVDYNAPACTAGGGWKNFDEYESFVFKIYKDYGDQNVWNMAGFKMRKGSGYPSYIITFPDTP